MQLEWHRHHSSPPSYEQQSDSSPVSPISPASEQPPTYQRASRSCSAPPVYLQRQISHTETIIDLYSFPPRSTILVVGAYTRQGMHIIDRLIENGHLVRGIVSNAREAAQVSKHFEASHGRGYYHSSIVTDMTVEGALDSTARGCSGVVFVTSQSSPLTNSTEERVSSIINALTSAVKEAGMDRFIYCSSPPAPRPLNAISTIEEDDEPVSRHSTTQPPRPSQWLSRNGGHEESITEETPIEIAMGKWIDLWEPKFALQTGKSLSLSHADLVATNNSLTSFKYLCPEASVLKSTRCSSKALSGERYKTAGTSPGISIRTCRERPWNKKLTTTNKIPRRNCRSVSSYLLQSWALRYDDNLQPARHDSSWDKSFFFCDLS